MESERLELLVRGRDWDGRERFSIAHGTYESLRRMTREMMRWQIARYAGERRIVLAQSANFSPLPVAEVMQENKDGFLAGDLFVDVDDRCAYIYFTARKPVMFDSHLKIYQGMSMNIEGNVTAENFAGFLKAVALAEKILAPRP